MCVIMETVGIVCEDVLEKLKISIDIVLLSLHFHM